MAVVGAGAFGGLAAQVARALGAARTVLLGTRAERVQRIRDLADAVVVGGGEAAIEDARAALGGQGADLVVEFAGTPDAARQAIQLARRGGRVVLAGATGPGRELSGVDLSTIVRGHLDIYGSLANPRGISGRGLQLIASGAVDVRPLITHCFALEYRPGEEHTIAKPANYDKWKDFTPQLTPPYHGKLLGGPGIRRISVVLQSLPGSSRQGSRPRVRGSESRGPSAGPGRLGRSLPYRQ